jgi:UDP-N-acetyl-D-mannosaminuronate dehydrogenase
VGLPLAFAEAGFPVIGIDVDPAKVDAIIGLGYVGLAFAEAGFPVIGIDVDPTKVDAINAGRSYISDIPTAAQAVYHRMS